VPKVLEGIRVLDFGRYIAAPFAATLLGEMGAEVVRVEPPGGSEDRTLGPSVKGHSIFVNVLARNKKGITLNLSSPKGQQLLDRLVPYFDVIIENFPPQAKRGLGLTYERLKGLNPSIILASVSAFGEQGVYAERVGFDTVFQAMSGAMHFCGFPGNPPTRAQIPIIDFSTAFSTSIGILLALYHRQKTGEGQKVELSLFDTAVSLVSTVIAENKFGFVRQQIGNQSFYTFSNCFPSKDGWVMICPIGNPQWKRFSQAIGHPELASDPRFKDDISRFENRHLLEPIVSQWVKERTAEEVIHIMDKAKVPCGKVNTIPELLADPHFQSRDRVVEWDFPDIGAFPLPRPHIGLCHTPGGIERRAPLVGEHNGEIYGGLLGLSSEELLQLQKEGVI